jgi:hypothetical protein
MVAQARELLDTARRYLDAATKSAP